jgi:RND superfamily putative drug exporter
MSRIREEARETSLPEAVTRALAATGTTITSAGLILAATFGVAGLAATTDQTRQLTLSIAIGILLDTFLVRTLLVPSVVALLGRWNWWPSRLAGPTARGHVDDTDAPQARRLEAPIPTQAAFATTPQRRPGQSDS